MGKKGASDFAFGSDITKGYSICTWGGGGGMERSPIKKSWGEGVKMKKLGVYMKKKSWGGGGLKLWAFHPPPPMYIQME